MVVHLYLDTEMENCYINDSESTLAWDMQNMRLPEANCIALSSINIQYARNGPRTKILTNLIQPDFLNPDGVLLSLPPPRTREVSEFFPILQFWKMDSSPRMINLTFPNVNINIVRFASFTFAIN